MGLEIQQTDLTVIFVLNDTYDISLKSLQAILKYSNPELSNVIVALNGKGCEDMGDMLERELRYYIKYDNKKELNKYISDIINHCPDDYVAVVEDQVIVCPDWDYRLVSHLKSDPKTGIIAARSSEVLYDSIYDFMHGSLSFFSSQWF